MFLRVCFRMCFRECFFMNVFPIGLQYDLNYIRKFWSCCYLSFHCFSIKLKTRSSIVSCKTRNHPKTSPATHKPAKLSTNCRQISQTIHKPSKNHLPTSQITHKPTKYWTNHPKTSQLCAENQFFMLPKTLATMQIMCQICNHFTPFHQRVVGKIKAK